MSNITVNIMFGWCGIIVATNRNHIIADILTAPEGIYHLNVESTEWMVSTYQDCTMRTAAEGGIMFTRINPDQIIALK